ncbi:LysM peptidoglycan-binding domain-containing protein [Streptomyces ficellus]|uniref:LysM peptidoglycan-binding domain-containing protein n=1 Tax=Streptomyces ficellus TaxID=1977088 RepID=A0A6I6FP01_9ACTN|nr:LysM peptidoglycan-binding domain-containing protein [Streptomyces ficellus]QGV82052.1 LysM peptidoglycan-binding domain-containing protein [Streptomyces ficellus]
MPAKGKHRRPKSNPLARRFVAAGTGGAALALPMIGATAAEAAPSTAPAVAQAVTAASPAAAPAKAPATYSVVAGDTLSGIAQEHGVSGGWQKLYEDNRKAVGADPSLIRPGLKLTIGGKAAAERASAPERADRSAARTATQAVAKTTTYANNLDGWIREALDIMKQHNIPGSYEGIHRNIMRESSGNPMAINNWDSNAAAGTPSKGLLQVIAPTFQAYHVPGTANDAYDPVANITAACNYAADRYGSIDNVNGPY